LLILDDENLRQLILTPILEDNEIVMKAATAQTRFDNVDAVREPWRDTAAVLVLEC